jgi:SnoaL-like domain
MTPEEVVGELFARVRAGDIAVADLYAEDGVLDTGDATCVGRDAIRDYYARVLQSGIQPNVEALYAKPPLYAAQLCVTTPGGEVRVLDLFEVGDGEVRSLRVFHAVGGAR